MKNKIWLMALIFAGIFSGCQKDAYEAPNSLTDVGFYNSAGTKRILRSNISDYLSFTNLSQGYKQHSWTIDDGNAYLKGPITRVDSVFDKFIHSTDTISQEKTIHVLFRKPGMNKVRLYNVFDDSVTFRGHNGTSNYLMPSVKVGNKWVIDTTFMVKVYDSIVPQIEVRQNNIVLNHESTDTVYVEAGDFLKLSDLTTQGEPTGRNWIVKNAPVPGVPTSNAIIASSSLPEADILFKRLGKFIITVNLFRTGQDIPGAFKSYTLKMPVKVIPSSKPFSVSGAIREQSDETITIPFNGEFAPFIDQKSFFTVKVNGNVFPIASIGINPSDATLLDLKLVNKIYRPDVIKVSYSGTGTLKSTDQRSPLAFTDLPVVMNAVNLIPSEIAGLETGSNIWQPYWSNKGTVTPYSTEQAASGTRSLKMSIKPGQANVESTALFSNPVAFDGSKTYILSFKIYVDPSSTVTTSTATQLFLIQNWSFNFYQDLSSLPKGQWVTVSTDYKTSIPLSRFYLRILENAAKNQDLTVYIDDFSILEKEVRP